jgi:class 3 adenylate cyclase/predicted ATPase
MFCDLVGSTQLSGQLDPEDLRDVMRAYQEATGAAIARFGGHVAQTLGDGLMVYFGYPVAHEDDAQRSVGAGLEILSAIAALNKRLEVRSGIVVAVRVGIHTGLVVAGEVGHFDTRGKMAVIGETPNVAARVEALAKPNTVVISARTHRLVGTLFDFEDLGAHALKGVAAPVRLYQVTGSRTAESRFEAMHPAGLTPFVGRDEEIGLLKGRWGQARDGEGQVVLLCGEPGIGKSRITSTFRDLVAEDEHIRLHYQCSPFFINSAFYPVIQQLEFAAGMTAQDKPEAKLGKLEAVLARSANDVAAVAPLFAAMMSLPTARYPPLNVSPQRQKELTIAALVDQIPGLAKHAPVLMVFEDVHWIDPTTLETLDHVIAAVAELPVLVIVTFRPEFEPHWGGVSHVTVHTLNRLGRRQCAAMITRVTGDKPLPDLLRDQIVAKTDGVPLFIEELTKAVIESDIVVDAGARYALSGSVDAIAIPDTLHDSLMARLDKLIPVKAVAQIGAAIGREFSHQLMAALSPMSEADLNAALDRLVASQLVYRRGAPPEATYIFKHALVQDAAYNSLLKRDRQTLHTQIAETLLATLPAIPETEPELIAHHYTQAQRPDEAIPYWLRAGQRALRTSALPECVDHLTRGLACLGEIPDWPQRDAYELDIQTTLGIAHMAWKGYASPECGQAYKRAHELIGTVSDTSRALPVVWGYWSYYLVAGDHHCTIDAADRALSVAEASQDPDFLVQAYSINADTQFWIGNPRKSVEFMRKLRSIYHEERHGPQVWLCNHDALNLALMYAAHWLWVLGYPDQAVEAEKECYEQALRLQHPYQMAFGNCWASSCYHYRGEPDALLARLATGVAVAEQFQIPMWIAATAMFRGWWRAKRGEISAGIEQFSRGFDHYRAIGCEIVVPWWRAQLAQLHSWNGESDRALALVSESVAQVDRWLERAHEAEIYRIQGDILLGKESPETQAAEEAYQQAIRVAQAQHAKGWELRAAIALAHLWQSQGYRAKSCNFAR